MSARSFQSAEAQRRVASAISSIEAASTAEIVVAVRGSSGYYRHVDYLVGVVASLAGLGVFLFHPMPMRVDLFALEAPLLFAAGALLSAWVAPLRRALTSKGLFAENVRRAARAAFVDLGVSRTKARSGLLVYVSLFERRVEVVPDVGLDVSAIESGFGRAVARMEQAVAGRPDVADFTTGLEALGKALAELAPARAGELDEDELPNEMSVTR